MKISQAETFAGILKIRIRDNMGNDIIVYACTNTNKVIGVHKSLMDDKYKNIKEQDIVERDFLMEVVR